jgi:hypothetical protein
MIHAFKCLMPLVGPATVALLSIQPAFAATAAWAATGAMTAPRTEHTATSLNTGKVLVAGGNSGTPFVPAYASAELYNPTSGTSAAAGSLFGGRTRHAATLLADARVLVAGGFDAANKVLAGAESMIR